MVEILEELQLGRCDRLRERYPDFVVSPSGALRSGHHFGAKLQSREPNEHFTEGEYYEIDVRLGVDFEDFTCGEDFLKSLGGKTDGKVYRSYRYGRMFRVRYIYSHECIDGERVEWEYSIVDKSHLELAEFFNVLFNPEEIEYQKNARREIYNCPNFSKITYSKLKLSQNNECLWRLVAAVANSSDSIVPEVKLMNEAGAVVEEMVRKWNDGMWGSYFLDRWATTPIPPPEWVSKLELLQNELQNFK